MIEKTKNILNKKHVLIIGKSEIERRNFINDLIVGLNFEVYRFPSNMKLFDEYYDFVKKKKLYEPWYKAKSYNGSQILDFHWDWISENNALIVMEEFEQMEESWRIELLRIYLNEIENRKKGEKKIHLIISQESENGLTEKLAKVIDIRENERRTEKQVVQQNLEIINI
ncbi:hypothetical protein C8N46_103404 [Kordia periserrulae]|uniref:AAA domain-containing protein n=1 Tax=Kordia periserrulae TaxID=701523 RepID=A0A2T6C1V9_9FLAO|nr:hypothetical protein [Kordia periserrulae]PTX62304.1 hypothetical protein C8N46_103404 [Kordia periserrulae]